MFIMTPPTGESRASLPFKLTVVRGAVCDGASGVFSRATNHGTLVL